MRIAVIGATGIIGREIVAELVSLDQAGESPFEAPTLFATSRSASESVAWTEGDDLTVEPYQTDSARGHDLALVATPAEPAVAIIAQLRQLGVTVVDLSRAHRGQVPVYLDGAITPSAALASTSVLGLPSGDALQLARVVAPLRELGLQSAQLTILRASSGAGQAGMIELAESTGRLLNGQEPENPALGHRLAFNAVPQVGPFTGPDAQLEDDLRGEARRLMGGLPVAATALWCPWFYGHLQVVTFTFSRPVSADQLRDRLKVAPAVKVLDQPDESIYPMPMLATGDEAVLVGRIRADTSGGVQLVSVMDNARASAAHAVAAAVAISRARTAH